MNLVNIATAEEKTKIEKTLNRFNIFSGREELAETLLRLDKRYRNSILNGEMIPSDPSAKVLFNMLKFYHRN